MQELNLGDVVALKSGGPPMSVNRFIDDAKMISVVWIYDDKVYECRIPAQTLRAVDPDLVHLPDASCYGNEYDDMTEDYNPFDHPDYDENLDLDQQSADFLADFG